LPFYILYQDFYCQVLKNTIVFTKITILLFYKAVETIDNWNLLCEHGITVTLENNTDIQYIANASEQLKTTSTILKTATTTLKNKLSQYKYC
jgi:hypothetical protein